jgi:hypothetical protein
MNRRKRKLTKDDICKWIHMAWDFTSEDNLKRKFEYQEAHYIPYEKFARLVAEHDRESRQWVGLTSDEFEQAVDGLEDLEDCWVQIEKLQEKNT